jgi:hypothetical protein
LQRSQSALEFPRAVPQESLNLRLGLDPNAATHRQHGAEFMQYLHNFRMALGVRRTGGSYGNGHRQAAARNQADRFSLRQGAKPLLNILRRAEDSIQDILHQDVSTIEGQKL